jgi:hypothetical protein
MTLEALQQITDASGKIPVRLEQDVVRFRIGRLYASPESGFRELYANELRACRIARDKFSAKPRIEITVNHADRTITIHGIDSLGITEDKFLNVLSVLGETDNVGGSEIGQFGWGMAAAATLSDSVMYETHARETGERYAFLGIAGEHFSKLPQPTLDSPGTRITVYPRNEICLFSLTKRIQHICAYADIDTFLTEIHPTSEDFNTTKTQPQQINDPDPTQYMPHGTLVKVDDDDFVFIGTFTPEPATHPINDFRLLDLPIQADLKFPFDVCILKIKDERKYRPTADRERLTDDASERLAAKIKERLSQTLPSILDINSFEDFRGKASQYIYYNLGERSAYSYRLYEDGRERAPLKGFYTPPEKTCELAHLLQMFGKVLNPCYSYASRGRTVTARLGDLVARSRNLFLVDHLHAKLQQTLRIRHSDAIIFASKGPLSDGRLAALRAQGVRTDACTEAEDIKLSLKSETPRRTSRREPIAEEMCHVIIHTSRIRSVEEHGRTYDRLADKTTEMALCDAPDDAVFVPNIEKYLSILAEVYSTRGFSRLDKIPKTSHSRRMVLSRFVEEHAAHSVATNRGALAFKTLSEAKEPITVLVYEDSRIATVYPSTDNIFIPLKDEEVFELAIFLCANDKNYTIAHVPSEEEFEKATGTDRWNYGYRDGEYNSDANAIVNMVYHVGLAVKDERLKHLFYKAAQSAEAGQLRAVLNFIFDADQRLSASGRANTQHITPN